MSDYSDEEVDDIFYSSEDETYEVSGSRSDLSPRRRPSSRRTIITQ